IQVIKPGGFIQFKTDNDGLFEFTLEEIEACGLTASEMSRDLHSTDFKAKDTVTEYEERFINRSTPIKYVRIIV
ncbi:MAG: tRNA (guanosine(46)-N7)-methyltransferase TrmB, partial [Firmicutes bacterium]|nr:tRNA (guanosine(46)-N7)-methyltransferase TrmB [Bacillota bacterium]